MLLKRHREVTNSHEITAVRSQSWYSNWVVRFLSNWQGRRYHWKLRVKGEASKWQKIQHNWILVKIYVTMDIIFIIYMYVCSTIILEKLIWWEWPKGQWESVDFFSFLWKRDGITKIKCVSQFLSVFIFTYFFITHAHLTWMK